MTEPTCGHADDEIWGARARVLISSELDLESVARQLGATLEAVDFWFDTDMFPPHDRLALAEVMGFELQLDRQHDREGSTYQLAVWTTDTSQLILPERQFDLSPWLARYLRDIGHLQVSPTEDEVTGAKAEAYLSSDLDLAALAAHLATVLGVVFEIDTDMFPPHEEFAMGGALGFTLWLYHSADIEGFNYHLSMETTHSHDALFADRMVDLSHWLESYLRLIGDLDVASVSCTSAQA